MRLLVLPLVLTAIIVTTKCWAAATTGEFFIGQKADIAAIKAIVHKQPGDQVLGAHIAGDYALIQWYNQYTSEPKIYKRISGEKWKMLMTGGGGPMFLNNILQRGVSESIARRLCSDWPKGYGLCVKEEKGKMVTWP